ncbi:hypothetical protein C0993_006582 [Termitomyces sp. T159_Od127]|nr:hypothetical protein C0993_006582 [Termitomyces sp. T159_Od127]
MSSTDAQQQPAAPIADDAGQTVAEKTEKDHLQPSSDDDKPPGDGEQSGQSSASTKTPESTPWQAVYSPQYNAYYFYNTETHQTTWDNPLVVEDPVSSSQDPVPSTSTMHANPQSALEAAAIAAGIDPSLAYLDPTLVASVPGASTPSTSSGVPPSFTAKFNARTGQFTRPDARDPTHLSEHARAARMSEFYFDVNAWEDQLAQQGGSIMGSEGKKRKRPSKKDLERFKEQKKQKKLAKTAWLRT